jgi:hypothetical protein
VAVASIFALAELRCGWQLLVRQATLYAMKSIVVLFFVAALFVTGCDTINQEQYQIAGVSPGSPDAAKLKSILQMVADRTDLEDRTSESHAKNTLVFYSEPPQAFQVKLGARFYRTNVLVDLFADFGPKPSTFTQAKRLLEPALSAEFGPRILPPRPIIAAQ